MEPAFHLSRLSIRYLLCFLSLTEQTCLAQWKPSAWPTLKHYDKDHLVNIALPLGGIGTGTVSLGDGVNCAIGKS
ncbi:hypothetical protein [Spirosoma telluris]|uniref:hypothetical protein n=1 Tax=Spirosoma telluris TaxID=2183553 RepID=UPI002FC39C78